ncbi:MAG: hypothetical protein ACWGSD_11355, partial [Thermodesulfobacteriota bacterium]
GGKIPLLPNYVSSADEEVLTLTNYEGRTFTYPDPQRTDGEDVPDHSAEIRTQPSPVRKAASRGRSSGR